jgi:malate dehydrogenase (oxaloacetate-decarboxylating)
MKFEGLSEEESRSLIWLIDSRGLVHSARADLEPAKRRYAQSTELLAGWQRERTDKITLDDVVRNIHPTILIGTSAQPGAFTENIVRMMASNTARPVIFPLSNPTSKSEASPDDILNWTEGRAIVATGSPFKPVAHNGRTFTIGQCNNAFIFPGVGLGVLASKAERVTQQMFVSAAVSLSKFSPMLADPFGALYPPLETVRDVSREVAFTVGIAAQHAGLAKAMSSEELKRAIEMKIWTPNYRPLIYKAS